MRRITTLLALSLLATTAAADEAGTIRIPASVYHDLKTRAEKTQDPESPDETEGGTRVVSAQLTGTLDKRALNLELRITVEGRGEGWHSVSLLPTDVPLLDAQITGGTGTVIFMDGFRALAFEGPGRRTLVAHMTSAGEGAGSMRQVALNILPGISRELNIVLGDKVDAELEGATLVGEDRAGGKRALVGWLTPQDGEVQLRWNTDGSRRDDALPTTEPREKGSKEPARINVQTSMLASVGERLLTVYATLRYAIFHAPVSRFEWTVPAGAEVIGVQGRGVSDWTCSSGTGERTCSVELPFPVQRTYELSIQLEQPLAKDVTSVSLPVPVAKGVQRQSGHIAVEVMGNAEVQPVREGTTATHEDIRELPADLFTGQSTPILLAFKFLEAPVKVELTVQRRESLEMSPISVDDAAFTTVWTTEGRTITEGNLLIRNRQRQFLSLKLPEGAVIQSAFVGQDPVKPSTSDKGDIRIPLKTAGLGAGSDQVAVQLVYARDNLPIPTLGRLRAELPSMDAEIGALHHTLILPDRQKLWAFDGDLSTLTPRVFNDDDISHGRSLSGHSFGGVAELDLMDAPIGARMAMAPPPAAAPAQVQTDPNRVLLREERRPSRAKAAVSNIGGLGLEDQMGPGGGGTGMMQMAQSPLGQTGVLPVRIQIPQRGDRYMAHAFYVPPNRAMSWNARALSRSATTTLYSLLAALGFALGALVFRQGRSLMERKGINSEQAALVTMAFLSVLLTVYFRRHMMMLPGFLVVGAVTAWAVQQVRSRRISA
ncbi:MAG: hypothetical protein AB2A00_20315 [Myxococcota bacterium]